VSIEFGQARGEDLPQLVELLGLLFSQEAEFTPDAAKQATALAAMLDGSFSATVYVARDADRVIATASLVYGVSTAEGGKAASLEDVIVAPAARGCGIGTALLRYVIEQARTEGVLRITLMTDMQNERAQALYRKLGFALSPMMPMRLHLTPEKKQ
jgi:ribosomal protein S18 acetylase RimI-like enzyme